MEQTNTNISQLSTIELKALAYDQMVQLELSQNNLRIINQELAKRAQQSQTTAVASQVISPLPPGSIQRV